MVFSGRKRGRGFRGGIHATTRKSSGRSGDDDRPRRSRSRDRSRSPAPVRSDRLGHQYSKERSPTPQESLRITVGNDIYVEPSGRGNLSERLGPPVEKTFEKSRYNAENDIYEQERLYYGDAPDRKRRSQDEGNRGFSPSYRQSDRRRDDHHRDRGSSRDDYDRRDRRNEKDRGIREDDRFRQSPRGRYGMDQFYGSERGSRERSLDNIDRGHLSQSPHRYGDPYDRGDFPVARSPPRTEAFRVVPAPEAKPLKSILKKKTTSAESVYQDPPKALDPYTVPRDTALFPAGAPASLPSDFRQASKPSTNKLVPYMDVEEEERFLYGDGEADTAQNRRGRPDSSWEEDPSRSQNFDGRRGSYPPMDRDQNNSFQLNKHPPNLGKQTSNISQSSYMSQQSVPSEPSSATSNYTPDLLSMFTNKPTSVLTTPTSQQSVETKKKENYDPTIENILKSIGFDFEMSKRMQEKAQNTAPKPKEEPQFGINQTASFLEGGLSADEIKNKLFKSKETAVESFIREVKEQSHTDVSDRLSDRESVFDREASFSQKSKFSSAFEEQESKTGKKESLVDQFLNMDSVFDLKKSRQVEPLPPGVDDYPNTKTTNVTSPTSLNYPATSSYQGATSSHQAQAHPYQTSASLPYQPPVSAAPGQMYGSTTQASPYQQYSYPPYGTTAPYSGAIPVSQGYGALPGTPSYAYPGPPPGYGVAGYPQYPGHQPPESFAAAQEVSPTDRKGAQRSTTLRTVPLKENTSPTEVKANTDKEVKAKKDSKRPNLREIPKTDEPLTKVSARPKVAQEAPQSGSQHSGVYRTVLPPRSGPNNKPLDKKESLDKSTGKDSLKRSAPEDSPSGSRLKTITPKQKEKLLREKEERQKRIRALEDELDKLKRQQNEIMRKKRRQRDGHRDPILLQNSKLQEEIALQISKLRKATEENAKQLSAGVVAPEGAPATKKAKSTGEESSNQKNGKDTKTKKESQADEKEDQKPKQQPFQVKMESRIRYEFFDRGGHWCSVCNDVFSSVLNYLEHQHSSKHWKRSNHYDRPWMPDDLMNPPPKKKGFKVEVVEIKGSEFLVPVKGFYCTLCKELCGDEVCGEFHLKSDSHFMKYQAYLKENLFYEQRRKLDKATGVAQKQESEREEKKKLQVDLRVRKNQLMDQMIKDRIKLSEKPVKELSDTSMEETPGSVAKQAKIKLSLRKSTDGNKRGEEKSESSEKGEENVEDSSTKKASEESKKQISIKISNKSGIVGKIPSSKNPLLPPWTPVSKQEVQKPPSLEKFLSLEGGKAKSIPLVTTSKKPMVTAQDILNAFSGKSKDTNSQDKGEETSKEEDVEFGPKREPEHVIETSKLEEDTEMREDSVMSSGPYEDSDKTALFIPLPPTSPTQIQSGPELNQEEKSDLREAQMGTCQSQLPLEASPENSQSAIEANVTAPEANIVQEHTQENEEKELPVTSSDVPSSGLFLAPTVSENNEDECIEVNTGVSDIGENNTDSNQETVEICQDVIENPIVGDSIEDTVNILSENYRVDDTPLEISQGKTEKDSMSMEVKMNQNEDSEQNDPVDPLPSEQNDPVDPLPSEQNDPVESFPSDAATQVQENTSAEAAIISFPNVMDIPMPPDDTEAHSDAESDCSGVSMHIGSDFEVIDECEED